MYNPLTPTVAEAERRERLRKAKKRRRRRADRARGRTAGAQLLLTIANLLIAAGTRLRARYEPPPAPGKACQPGYTR